ncbi:MAG: universal stress protein [Ktedonobacteraceae bacterium]|nr:universal stress protein [Ktedonobacteraceae bacterium]
MFQRIIVPLDESPIVEQAIGVAARIAQASDGSLHTLRCHCHRDPWSWCLCSLGNGQHR